MLARPVVPNTTAWPPTSAVWLSSVSPLQLLACCSQSALSAVGGSMTRKALEMVV